MKLLTLFIATAACSKLRLDVSPRMVPGTIFPCQSISAWWFLRLMSCIISCAGHLLGPLILWNHPFIWNVPMHLGGKLDKAFACLSYWIQSWCCWRGNWQWLPSWCSGSIWAYCWNTYGPMEPKKWQITMFEHCHTEGSLLGEAWLLDAFGMEKI